MSSTDLFLTRRPMCIKSDSSRFMISMSNRQSHTSTVTAILSLCATGEKRRELLESFCFDLDKAADLASRAATGIANGEAVSNHVQPPAADPEAYRYGYKKAKQETPQALATKAFHETIWKITAAIIQMKPGIDEKLLFALTRSPMKLFSSATMKVIVECWNWLLSARPDLEMKFLQEMIAAWHSSQAAGLGLFNVEEAKYSPLAPDEEMKTNLRPNNPDIGPHDVWIRFIHERIEVAKYYSQEQIIMFTRMLQRTLDISVGNEKATMSRHIAAAGTRFRLLNCGMSLLQGDVLPRSVAKNTLRQRIYSASLDYFCSDKSFPTQSGVALREDIHIMLKFWTSMHQDRKHIKTSAIGGSGGGGGADGFGDMMSVAALGAEVLDRGRLGGGSSMADTRSVSSEFPRTPSAAGGWTNTGGGGGGGTLNKRSASRQQTRSAVFNDSFVKDYTKKRWLILALLSVEVEALAVNENPLEPRDLLIALMSQRDYGNSPQGNVGKQFDDAMKFLDDVRLRLPEKSWQEYARNAWDVSPSLAVSLPGRLNCSQALEREVSRLVRGYPEEVCHLPRALDFFLTKEALESDAPELPYVLTWAVCSPVRALSLLCPRTLPTHPLTAQYAVRVLSSYPADAVLFYIPQLVQATRYDDLGFVNEFVKKISKESNLVAHQLIWNIQTNMFRDEDGLEKDPVMHDKLVPLRFVDRISDGCTLLYKTCVLRRDAIVDGLNGPANKFYQREFDFFKKVTSVSGKIKEFPKGQQRKIACVKALQEVALQHGCYLPSNPDSLVLDIDRNSGQPMQSAAKAPYLARFKVRSSYVAAAFNQVCLTRDQFLSGPPTRHPKDGGDRRVLQQDGRGGGHQLHRGRLAGRHLQGGRRLQAGHAGTADHRAVQVHLQEGRPGPVHVSLQGRGDQPRGKCWI